MITVFFVPPSPLSTFHKRLRGVTCKSHSDFKWCLRMRSGFLGASAIYQRNDLLKCALWACACARDAGSFFPLHAWMFDCCKYLQVCNLDFSKALLQSCKKQQESSIILGRKCKINRNICCSGRMTSVAQPSVWHGRVFIWLFEDTCDAKLTSSNDSFCVCVCVYSFRRLFGSEEDKLDSLQLADTRINLRSSWNLCLACSKVWFSGPNCLIKSMDLIWISANVSIVGK